MSYLNKTVNKNNTPQSEPLDAKQVQNNAGGFSYAVDKWQKLNRFLILGTEGGTYYVGERKLTQENMENVVDCLVEDGMKVIHTIKMISEAGRAPKNDPALLVLALASVHKNEKIRAAAYLALPFIARTGTHLFQFVEFRKQLGGKWGRGVRNAIGRWYSEKTPESLAYQVVKYKNREGWSHRDLLRLAHPMPKDSEYATIYKWVVSQYGETVEPGKDWSKALQFAAACSKIQYTPSAEFEKKTTMKDVCQTIRDFNLPREALPTELLKSADVWDALLGHMPMTAMIRNLGNMSKVGLLTPMSDAERKIIAELSDEDRLKKARIHPISVLAAMLTYKSGHGFRGNSSWDPSARVVEALDSAFYKTFQYVEPTEKRIMLCLDVSGSMGGSTINGMPYLTARAGSAAMAMVMMRTEPNYYLMGFTGGFVPLDINKTWSLDHVISRIDDLPFEGTDCAVPMLFAMKRKMAVDAFVVLTDSETWAGGIHPVQALKQYRQQSGIGAKLVVVGMTSSGFTIADPEDRGSLDVVGFDTATPQMISDFIADKI